MWAADDADENAVEGLRRTLRDLDVTSSSVSLDVWILWSA